MTTSKQSFLSQGQLGIRGCPRVARAPPVGLMCVWLLEWQSQPACLPSGGAGQRRGGGHQAGGHHHLRQQLFRRRAVAHGQQGPHAVRARGVPLPRRPGLREDPPKLDCWLMLADMGRPLTPLQLEAELNPSKRCGSAARLFAY
jgi:hypothetical protein